MSKISPQEQLHFNQLVNLTRLMSRQDPSETYFLFTPLGSNKNPPYVSNDYNTSKGYGSCTVDKFINGTEDRSEDIFSLPYDMD
jgi:hypothetical protein